MRLLVTRPEPDARALADELLALGHEPIVQPLLEFRTLEFDEKLTRSAQAIVVTSGNCLRALTENCDLADIASVPLYCVGDETAKRARVMGFDTLLAVADTAEELAGKIVASAHKDAPLVHLTGEHQAFDLAGALAENGFQLHTVRVYSMEAARDLLPSVVAMITNGEADGVLLMSPRTADIYVSLCHRHGIINCAKTLSYFCLSENIAAKLTSLKPDHVHVAEKPNRKALLDLLRMK